MSMTPSLLCPKAIINVAAVPGICSASNGPKLVGGGASPPTYNDLTASMVQLNKILQGQQSRENLLREKELALSQRALDARASLDGLKEIHGQLTGLHGWLLSTVGILESFGNIQLSGTRLSDLTAAIELLSDRSGTALKGADKLLLSVMPFLPPVSDTIESIPTEVLPKVALSDDDLLLNTATKLQLTDDHQRILKILFNKGDISRDDLKMLTMEEFGVYIDIYQEEQESAVQQAALLEAAELARLTAQKASAAAEPIDDVYATQCNNWQRQIESLLDSDQAFDGMKNTWVKRIKSAYTALRTLLMEEGNCRAIIDAARKAIDSLKSKEDPKSSILPSLQDALVLAKTIRQWHLNQID